MREPTNAAPPLALTRPSARLERAVAAERRGLERRRGQLLRRRERVLAQLEPIDRALAELHERVALLQVLDSSFPVGDDAADAVSARSSERTLLRGPAIREAAVRTLRTQPHAIEALHYRDWYELVRHAGHTIAGADPLAVFLTQLTRSPLVKRSTQPGVYALDLAAPQRLRSELDRLGRELRDSAASELHATDLASARARRRVLQLSIDRHERALEEALRTLAPDELDRRRTPDPTHPSCAASTTGPPEASGSSAAINHHGEEQGHAQP
jgi:hypothetical protein